jgi:hypothetical protein
VCLLCCMCLSHNDTCGAASIPLPQKGEAFVCEGGRSGAREAPDDVLSQGSPEQALKISEKKQTEAKEDVSNFSTSSSFFLCFPLFPSSLFNPYPMLAHEGFPVRKMASSEP